MTVLIDSNVWIEYLQGSPIGKKALPYIEGEGKVIISAINISEIYGHILRKKGKENAEAAVDFLVNVAFVIPVDMPTALLAASIKNDHELGLGDALIYATAKLQKATLVTADNDFRGKEGVICISR